MPDPILSSTQHDFGAQRSLLLEHPLLREMEEQSTEDYLASLGDARFASFAYAKRGQIPYIQPRGGFGTFEQQLSLVTALMEADADFIPLTIDSHTRHNDYERAQVLLDECEATGKPLLNGYPLLTHGPLVSRRLFHHVEHPVSLRHGTPDARLLVEAALYAGITEIEGGGLCYCLPYARAYPVDRALLHWRYVDRLCAMMSTPERPIQRESFGPLTATLVPPVMVVVVQALELMMAAELGVKAFSVSFGQTGSLPQDLATGSALRTVTAQMLQKKSLQDVRVRMVFHQWMGPFPEDRVEAEALIVQSAMIANLINADKVVTKTRDEALGIPSPESNVDAVRQVRYTLALTQETDTLGSPFIQEESDAIVEAALSVLSAIDSMDGLGLWDKVARAVRRGVIDIPFSPHQDNANQLWTARDPQRCIRVVNPGQVPLPDGFLAREKTLLSRRHEEASLDNILRDIRIMVTLGAKT